MPTSATPRNSIAPTTTSRPPGEPGSDGVQRAVDGDPAAIAVLLRAIRGPVTSVIQRVLGSQPAEVPDATQQALIAFLRALPSFRGECSPTAFARTIAVRTAVAIRRRARAMSSREDDNVGTDALRSELPAPSDHAAAEQRRELLRRLLDEIPPEQAEALAMRVVLGWSLEEIASRSGAPLNTVRSRIRLAKEALRRKIEASPAALEVLRVEM